MNIKFFIVPFMLAAGGAFALNCNNPQNSYEIQFCLNKKVAAQKSVMNKTYNQLYNRTEAKKELEAAQKAWLKYRDLQCGNFTDVDSDNSPGSIAYSLSCLYTLNNQRIEILKELQ